MNTFETLKNLRKTILNLTEGLTIEQLNKIPEGFNNNIAWNLGHLIAAQQGVCYTRAGLPTFVADTQTAAYKPGTKPEKWIDEKEIETIKTGLIPTIEQLEKDYYSGLFKTYQAFTTRYGVELTSIEEGINFIPFHDGFHMGYMLALKRLV